VKTVAHQGVSGIFDRNGRKGTQRNQLVALCVRRVLCGPICYLIDRKEIGF
jgi:hypothetical protein